MFLAVIKHAASGAARDHQLTGVSRHELAEEASRLALDEGTGFHLSRIDYVDTDARTATPIWREQDDWSKAADLLLPT
jgi:hypothetical protein